MELQEQLAKLSDSVAVHTNILRGDVALTRAQAIHIAGLPADIETQLSGLQEMIRAVPWPPYGDDDGWLLCNGCETHFQSHTIKHKPGCPVAAFEAVRAALEGK